MAKLAIYGSELPLDKSPFWRGGILMVAGLAFYLRLRFLTLFNFHIDEFFTLAAANFIAQSGLPRYPTGLFYDPGLPYSYLSGALFWLLGFSEALGRWPAVLFGTLAVATVYRLGRRILGSPAVGLLAALWLALSLESVEWGGRARMISLAQWLGLLAVGWLWLGLLKNSTRYRLLFAVVYGGTLLSHLAMVVLMPAWFIAAGVWWAIGAIRFQWGLVRDALVVVAAFALAISSGVLFQPPPSLEFQSSQAGLEAKVGELNDKFLQIPSDPGHAWEVYSPYFLDLPHSLILGLAALGLIISLARLISARSTPSESRSQPVLESRLQPVGIGPLPAKASTPENRPSLRRARGALYLGLIFLVVMAVLSLMIDPHWQRARYLLMQVQGLFLLLGAHGWRETTALIPPLDFRFGILDFGHQSKIPNPLALPSRTSVKSKIERGGWGIRYVVAMILALALSWPFLPPLEPIWEGDSGGWERYDQAFGHVKQWLAEGDKVMTMHPPAGLLYLNQSDYYLVQSSPKLIVRPDGVIGDRYSGAIWLKTAEEFNDLLAGSDKIWLVVEEFWLFNSYDGFLQQQILWQMDKLWGEGGVWALASRPDRWPLARDVDTISQAEFEGGTRLLGFTASPPTLGPGSMMHLTFFWQGNVPYGAKILVHIRDVNNNTVAQADHFIYDGKVPSSRWASLLNNDKAIRDGATLVLPPDLKPGSYHILVGFYHPETFERLGVIHDQSGESAVILGEWMVK